MTKKNAAPSIAPRNLVKIKDEVFVLGQLVKRRTPIDWPHTHFTGLLANNNHWVEDSKGRILFIGQVNIAYEDIGMIVEYSPDEERIVVLFGEHLVIQNTSNLVPYED